MPTSKKIYSEIRDIAPKFVEDRPFYEQIAKVEEYLREKPLALD